MVQEIYSKMHPVSCTNTHHDVTYFVNHGMVKNTKTWIFREQNRIFLWNKKILYLCLRWHILKKKNFFCSQVTFKQDACFYILLWRNYFSWWHNYRYLIKSIAMWIYMFKGFHKHQLAIFLPLLKRNCSPNKLSGGLNVRCYFWS